VVTSESPISVTEGPSEQAPVVQVSRLLRFKNETGEKLKIFVQYNGLTENGEWDWFPTAPTTKAKALEFTVEPGEETYFFDGERPIDASRVRIWAESSGKKWLRYKNEDLWLVPEVDENNSHWYNSEQMEVFTFALKS
jgi:hypothetical protein